MDHAEAERLLPDYRRGALNRERVRELHAHFKACEPCRLRLRLESAQLRAEGAAGPPGLENPKLQEQMARNRSLLIKILMLMALAVFVWKYKR